MMQRINICCCSSRNIDVCLRGEQDICVYTNAFAILGLVLFGRPVFWTLSTAYICLLGMPELVPVKVRNQFNHH